MKKITGGLFALLAIVGSGCSGINASKSISPLDFILPGLMQNTPSTPGIPGVTNPAPTLAKAPGSVRVSVDAPSDTAVSQGQASAGKGPNTRSVAGFGRS